MGRALGQWSYPLEAPLVRTGCRRGSEANGAGAFICPAGIGFRWTKAGKSQMMTCREGKSFRE